MTIIADTIEEAVALLNEKAADGVNYQVDENIVIEYNNNNEEETIEWSYQEEQHHISGKTQFRFYC